MKNSRFILWLLLLAALSLLGLGRVAAQAVAPGPAAAPTAPATAPAVPAAGQAAAPGAAAAAAANAPSSVGTGQRAATVRLADIASIQGLRANQLLGIGLVSGLSGKGDTSNATIMQQAVSNLVSYFGIQVPEKEIRSRNCAVVTVTADLPAFARPGDNLAVTVSSIGDAQDLTGGVLLQTNLRAANGQVYAVAQGFVATTSGNNAKTVGDIPSGAIVEQAVTTTFVNGGKVSVILRNPDFITAAAAAQAIQKAFPAAAVNSVDASDIEVTIPPDRAQDPVGFIAGVEQLTLTPDLSGKVVVNPRTGVVVVGENVRVGKVAVSYRDTRISIGGGDITSPYYGLNKAKNPFVLGETASVDDLVKTLQDASLSADTIIEILKAIDRAGALYGKLIVM